MIDTNHVRVAAFFAFLLAGTAPAAAQTAVANLQGGDISGVVTFTEHPSGIIRVLVEAENVPARGHGLHIHEVGECDPATDFESAGGHLSDGTEHGIAAENGPHAGDLPNVYAEESGVVRAEFFLRGFTLRDGGQTLLDSDGSAIVLHANPDDYESQPSGGSGARIACGVIELAEPG